MLLDRAVKIDSLLLRGYPSLTLLLRALLQTFSCPRHALQTTFKIKVPRSQPLSHLQCSGTAAFVGRHSAILSISQRGDRKTEANITTRIGLLCYKIPSCYNAVSTRLAIGIWDVRLGTDTCPCSCFSRKLKHESRNDIAI